MSTVGLSWSLCLPVFAPPCILSSRPFSGPYLLTFLCLHFDLLSHCCLLSPRLPCSLSSPQLNPSCPPWAPCEPLVLRLNPCPASPSSPGLSLYHFLSVNLHQSPFLPLSFLLSALSLLAHWSSPLFSHSPRPHCFISPPTFYLSPTKKSNLFSLVFPSALFFSLFLFFPGSLFSSFPHEHPFRPPFLSFSISGPLSLPFSFTPISVCLSSECHVNNSCHL